MEKYDEEKEVLNKCVKEDVSNDTDKEIIKKIDEYKEKNIDENMDYHDKAVYEILDNVTDGNIGTISNQEIIEDVEINDNLFEESFTKLEKIVYSLENTDLGIMESINLLEEAIKLESYCRKVLDEADLRLIELENEKEVL